MAHYNPEKRAWRGKSYRKGGRRVRALREALAAKAARVAS